MKGDVVPHGGIEEQGVLGHHPEVPAVAGLREVPDVRSVVADRAGADVEEAKDEVAERGLSGATGADDGDRFAPSDLEVDVAQHRTSGLVLERHAVQHDALLQGAGRHGAIRHHALRGEHLQDARGVPPGRGEHQALPEDGRQRPEKLNREIEEERGRREGQPSSAHGVKGDDEDDGGHERVGHQPDGDVHLGDDTGPPGRPAIGVRGRPYLTGLVALDREGLDRADAGERLQDPRSDIALAVGHALGEAEDQLLEDARHQQMDRPHREDGEREERVGAEHHEKGEGHLSGGLEDLADHDVQGPRHAAGVDGEPSHELSDPALVEVGQGQGQ